jgi:hypothetical protein
MSRAICLAVASTDGLLMHSNSLQISPKSIPSTSTSVRDLSSLEESSTAAQRQHGTTRRQKKITECRAKGSARICNLVLSLYHSTALGGDGGGGAEEERRRGCSGGGRRTRRRRGGMSWRAQRRWTWPLVVHSADGVARP